MFPSPEERRAVAIWKEYFAYGVNSLASTDRSETAPVFTDNVIAIDSDSEFEFMSVNYFAQSPLFFLRMSDDSQGRLLQRGNQDMRALGGQSFVFGEARTSGFLPFKWSVGYVIAAATTFTVSISSFRGSANDIRLAIHGNKLRPGIPPWRERQYRVKYPYTYEVDVGSVGASATSVAAVTIDKDADFLVEKLTAIRASDATVLVEEGARARRWSNIALHIDTLFGNGNLPHILSTPRFLKRGSSLLFTVADLSGAANRIRLYVHGLKLFG